MLPNLKNLDISKGLLTQVNAVQLLRQIISFKRLLAVASPPSPLVNELIYLLILKSTGLPYFLYESFNYNKLNDRKINRNANFGEAELVGGGNHQLIRLS